MPLLSFITIFACRPAQIAEKQSIPTQEETDSSENWWDFEELEDTSSNNDTSSYDTSKPDTGSYEEGQCDDNFNPNAECSGTWEETICLFEGLWWWCDNGQWLNEDDKPD